MGGEWTLLLLVGGKGKEKSLLGKGRIVSISGNTSAYILGEKAPGLRGGEGGVKIRDPHAKSE